MDKNSVFFGTEGLTSTSANHVANLAKEFAQNYELGVLHNFDFFDTKVGLIGSEDKSTTRAGLLEVDLLAFPDHLEKVIKAKSLIAWLREAIKAREAMLAAIKDKDIEDWCRENGFEFFGAPSRPDKYGKDDVLAEMDIKERNRIYELETKCAVIGKFIHQDGNFSDARKELLKVLNAPYEVKGEGRDALVYQYVPTCSEHIVNEIFFSLQAEHRATQAQLNSILHTIDEKVRAENLKRENEYSRQLREYDIKGKEMLSAFEVWKNEESKKIADLKIVVPKHLEEIYNIVNLLGKK